jgi:hypothetical protein
VLLIAIAMNRFIIEVDVNTASKKARKKSHLFPNGSCRAIKRNPHAIAVVLGPSTIVNYWCIISMAICTIAEYAI